ncbi:DUF2914 domain-containing protein [Candidatus Parcubacteria bacterium]|nr:DUF2914 domain-containing protein [Candidatus Parcubacteria bacterium]
MDSLPVLRDFIKRHERHVSGASVLFGFIWDSLTLGRPDSLFNNIVFITYLMVAAGTIILVAIAERRKRQAPVFALPVMQFSFGNLAGGLLVVYGQSGTFEGSALFFFLILAFILGNELARSYYARLSFHIAAWFFLIFAYMAMVVPILIGSIGDGVFILSGFASLAVVVGFLWLLRSIARERVVLARRQNIMLISVVFVIWNLFYFFHVLPPVPLSLQHIGIYHSAGRLLSDGYAVTYEEPSWWQFNRDTSPVFHREGDDAAAYCVSSVFAPGRLSATIEHVWERYDEASKSWEPRSVVRFPIAGGRQDGYRGYSVKFDLDLGRWRCSVETENGGLVGRTTFTVVEGKPALVQRVI